MAKTGSELIAKAEEIEIGKPNYEYLPGYVRTALKRHLVSVGIAEPRVLLVNWPKRKNHKDLVFNVEQSNFSTSEEYLNVMRSLVWFLPNGYQYISWDAIRNAHATSVPL